MTDMHNYFDHESLQERLDSARKYAKDAHWHIEIVFGGVGAYSWQVYLKRKLQYGQIKVYRTGLAGLEVYPFVKHYIDTHEKANQE